MFVTDVKPRDAGAFLFAGRESGDLVRRKGDGGVRYIMIVNQVIGIVKRYIVIVNHLILIVNRYIKIVNQVRVIMK